MKNVMLVGATDGIGAALAEAFVARSARVTVLGRSGARLQVLLGSLREAHRGCEVEGVVMDVTWPVERIEATLDGAAQAIGDLDLVVYCAGVLLEGPGAARAMLEVNTLGAIHVLEWAGHRLGARGSGRLAAIGSVAGDRGRAGNPAYCASKAGLHAYLEGLRRRLHPQGVGVTTIEPGWVRTRMLGRVPSFPPTVSAEAAAEAIVRGLFRGRDVLYVPAWWRLVSVCLRLTPRFLYKRYSPR